MPLRRRPRLAALGRLLPRLVPLAAAALLAACAGQAPPAPTASLQQAQHLVQEARPHYAPPGPPADPWGPYITEAATRYDVPQSWIRGVMKRESDGRQFSGDGLLTISAKGAMGLMQIMPDTYTLLRNRYGFGDDPYDPHNNILAGAAYLRALYDAYGTPAFLAAYNAGPGRLDKYLANLAPLPDETRRYVAAIAPAIAADQPARLSAMQNLAFNRVPDLIPPGLRHPRILLAASRRHRSAVFAAAPSARLRLARATLSRPHGGVALIGRAYADTPPIAAGGPAIWAIQVGAFGNPVQARAAAAAAARAARGQPSVGAVRTAHHTLYRARLTGLTREAALAACTRLHGACVILSPAAQS